MAWHERLRRGGKNSNPGQLVDPFPRADRMVPGVPDPYNDRSDTTLTASADAAECSDNGRLRAEGRRQAP